MILQLTLCAIACFVFFMTGYVSVLVYGRIVKRNITPLSPDIFIVGGLALTGAICGWISIFSAINVYVKVIYLLFIVALFIYNYRSLVNYGKQFLTPENIQKYAWCIVSVVITIGLMAAYAASTTIIVYDTALYHTHAIKWIQEYSVVPGLGNLHGRFALNSMSFLISGLFSTSYESTIVYPINLTLMIVVISRLLINAHHSIQGKEYRETVFHLLTLILLIGFNFTHLNSPTNDVTSSALIAYIFSILIQNKNFSGFSGINGLFLYTIIVFCITVKLSSAFLILLVIPQLVKHFKKEVIRLVLVGLVIAVPFFLRNYFLSGYLVYPFPGIDLFNPDWKIPVSTASELKNIISSWAKVPRVDADTVAQMSLTEWLPTWWSSHSVFVKAILLVNLSAPVFAIMALLKKQYFVANLWGVLIINVVFWFYAAPDPRFAYGFLFANLALTIAFGLPWQVVLKKCSLNTRQLVAPAVLMLVVVVVLFANHGIIRYKPWGLVIPLSNTKTPELEVYETNFSMYVPTTDNRCFNAPLPCTPYPSSNLELRGDQLQSGFRVAQ